MQTLVLVLVPRALPHRRAGRGPTGTSSAAIEPSSVNMSGGGSGARSDWNISRPGPDDIESEQQGLVLRLLLLLPHGSSRSTGSSRPGALGGGACGFAWRVLPRGQKPSAVAVVVPPRSKSSLGPYPGGSWACMATQVLCKCGRRLRGVRWMTIVLAPFCCVCPSVSASCVLLCVCQALCVWQLRVSLCPSAVRCRKKRVSQSVECACCLKFILKCRNSCPTEVWLFHNTQLMNPLGAPVSSPEHRRARPVTGVGVCL